MTYHSKAALSMLLGCMRVPAKSLMLCLFATPWTIAHQAPLSMGFSRQEHWSELPFPSPGDHPSPGTEPVSFTSACNAGLNLGRTPGSGRSPGEGNGNSLQYSRLENNKDRGGWWATVHGVAKSWTRLRKEDVVPTDN